jgi:hypothetical protein
MNRTIRKWLGRGAFMALVAGAMLIVGPRYVAALDCPYPSAGTCPPLTGTDPSWGTCSPACVAMGWTDGGGCIRGCCVCLM